MHHAFLISGRKGVGKGQLVHYLSAFILCNDNDIDVVEIAVVVNFHPLRTILIIMNYKFFRIKN